MNEAEDVRHIANVIINYMNHRCNKNVFAAIEEYAGKIAYEVIKNRIDRALIRTNLEQPVAVFFGGTSRLCSAAAGIENDLGVKAIALLKVQNRIMQIGPGRGDMVVLIDNKRIPEPYEEEVTNDYVEIRPWQGLGEISFEGIQKMAGAVMNDKKVGHFDYRIGGQPIKKEVDIKSNIQLIYTQAGELQKTNRQLQSDNEEANKRIRQLEDQNRELIQRIDTLSVALEEAEKQQVKDPILDAISTWS